MLEGLPEIISFSSMNPTTGLGSIGFLLLDIVTIASVLSLPGKLVSAVSDAVYSPDLRLVVHHGRIVGEITVVSQEFDGEGQLIFGENLLTCSLTIM